MGLEAGNPEGSADVGLPPPPVGRAELGLEWSLWVGKALDGLPAGREPPTGPPAGLGDAPGSMAVDDLLLSCAGIGRADVGLEAGNPEGSADVGLPPPPVGRAELGLE